VVEALAKSPGESLERFSSRSLGVPIHLG
jgi:hypothetical protein